MFNFKQIPPTLVPKAIITAPDASEAALPTKDKETTDKSVCTYFYHLLTCISFLLLVYTGMLILRPNYKSTSI